MSLHDDGMTESFESLARPWQKKRLKQPSVSTFSADTLTISFAP